MERRNAQYPSRFGALALAAVVLLGPGAVHGTVPEASVELATVLERLDRIAALYRDNALRFTCDETLTHFTGGGRRQYRFHYIFVYDDDDKLADYRLRRGTARPGKSTKKLAKAAQPVSLERYRRRSGMPPPVMRAYTWVNLFERSRWPHYEYRILGHGEVLGRPAIAIGLDPVRPHRPGVNDWVGTVWVDRDSYQLLRVEALKPTESVKKQRFEQFLERPPESKRRLRSTHVFSEIHTEYGVEMNGMRFPSEVVTRGVRYEAWAHEGDSGYREFPVFRLEQAYDNYQFFGVRTAEEIERLVAPQR